MTLLGLNRPVWNTGKRLGVKASLQQSTATWAMIRP